MPVKRISPEEAQALVDGEGYAYLDVRSIPEFEAGHPTRRLQRAAERTWGRPGMSPNPEFLSVVEKSLRQGREARRGLQGRRALAAGPRS